jgi:hypothetical protein
MVLTELERVAIDLEGVKHLISAAQALSTELGSDDIESLRYMDVLVQTVTFLEARLVVAIAVSPRDSRA